MVFWCFFKSFWVLGPILAHQTDKFKLNGQFCFSKYPWGPWRRLSSGVICISKIHQVFCDSGAALVDFFKLMKMLPNISLISMIIKKVFLSVSIANLIVVIRHKFLQSSDFTNLSFITKSMGLKVFSVLFIANVLLKASLLVKSHNLYDLNTYSQRPISHGFLYWLCTTS